MSFAAAIDLAVEEDTLGERIESLRSLAAMSARTLDALAGLQPGHTRIIETKEAGRVAAETIRKIASVFGVSLDWLFAGTGRRPSDAKIRAAAEQARVVKRTGTSG
jgi:transcriptional regulator with XRE-family HTH domain